MTRLAAAGLRRPWLTVGIWVVAVALLASAGIGIEKRLAQGTFRIPGTQSSQEMAAKQTQFGSAEFVPVLLSGPDKALERQGPRLVEALRRDTRIRVLSP